MQPTVVRSIIILLDVLIFRNEITWAINMSLDRFKLCNSCHRWLSVEDILSNPVVYPIGVAAHGLGKENLYFYFVHHMPDCMSTIMISGAELEPYIPEQSEEQSLLGSSGCPSHCTDLNDLRECPHDCQQAAFRRFFTTLQANRLKGKSRISFNTTRSKV